MRGIFALIAVIGALALAPIVRGGVLVASAGYSAKGGGVPNSQDSDTVNIGGGPISVSLSDPYGRAFAFGWSDFVSTPEYTSLRVRASSASGEFSAAGSSGYADYADRIFVDGGNYGDPVTLEISWLMSYDLIFTPGEALCNQNEARIKAYLRLGNAIAQFSDGTCTGIEGDLNVTVIENTFSGAELNFFGSLQGFATSGYGGSSSVVADKSLTPFIRSLTSGYGYSTASGNTYFPGDQPTSVPEGSSLLQMLGGLVAAAWGRRRGIRLFHG